MGMVYGEAIEGLKVGRKVTRSALRQSGVDYIYLVKGSRFTVSRPPLSPDYDGQEVSYHGHIDAFHRVPDGCVGAGELHAMTWTPTNDDQLADDWFFVD